MAINIISAFHPNNLSVICGYFYFDEVGIDYYIVLGISKIYIHCGMIVGYPHRFHILITYIFNKFFCLFHALLFAKVGVLYSFIAVIQEQFRPLFCELHAARKTFSGYFV